MRIRSPQNVTQHLPSGNEYCSQKGGGENGSDQIVETITRGSRVEITHLRRPMLCEMWPTIVPPRNAPTLTIMMTLDESCGDNPFVEVRNVG